MVNATDLREYLHLSPDDDGSTLELYISAAKEQLRVAGVDERDNDPLYDLTVLEIAGFSYDNRSLSAGGSYQATAITNMTKLLNAAVLRLRN